MPAPERQSDGSEELLLAAISRGGADGWRVFLDTCAGTIFKVASLFADTYDDRMDIFLHACERLREDDMRRLRAFVRRPEAPCSFRTYLRVVVRNLAIDHIRSKEGRFRPYRSVEKLDETDRMIFEYHLRDGLSIEETAANLSSRHGIRIRAGDLAQRAARVSRALTANQRWRLLSRLAARRIPFPIDTVEETLVGGGRSASLPSSQGDPLNPLLSAEAGKALDGAMNGLSPRHRLALSLRYRDGMSLADVGRVLGTSRAEAERLAGEALERLRTDLSGSGLASGDLEPGALARMWTVPGGR